MIIITSEGVWWAHWLGRKKLPMDLWVDPQQIVQLSWNPGFFASSCGPAFLLRTVVQHWTDRLFNRRRKFHQADLHIKPLLTGASFQEGVNKEDSTNVFDQMQCFSFWHSENDQLAEEPGVRQFGWLPCVWIQIYGWNQDKWVCVKCWQTTIRHIFLHLVLSSTLCLGQQVLLAQGIYQGYEEAPLKISSHLHELN